MAFLTIKKRQSGESGESRQERTADVMLFYFSIGTGSDVCSICHELFSKYSYIYGWLLSASSQLTSRARRSHDAAIPPQAGAPMIVSTPSVRVVPISITPNAHNVTVGISGSF